MGRGRGGNKNTTHDIKINQGWIQKSFNKHNISNATLLDKWYHLDNYLARSIKQLLKYK